ncbi:MAG: efflux RND transporter periplasmic adaptor subunit [Verrucomicrobiae bacterium]|nr:efflux RND transporter periplasmic adaptor subunit [Verrucomicrobiae bacterium]
MKAWQKWLIGILVVAVTVALGVMFWKRHSSESGDYVTTAVTRGDMVQAVTATGQLNPVVNVQVGSQISGMLEKINVDFNSTVKKGDVLAQIEPSSYQAAVHQAEADVASAQAAEQLTRVTLKRKQELKAKGFVAQADVDKAASDLDQALATIKMRQASLEKARVDLERCTIYSPIDGVVISRNVDVGQTVAASLNAPVLFTIANDLANMQIDANVAEADIANIRVDEAVDFTVDAFPYRTFHGKVRQIRNAPTTVQNVVTYDVVIDVNNKDLSLRPGMTANVSVIVAKRSNVLKIPSAALRFRPAGASASPITAAERPATNASTSAGETLAAGGEGQTAGQEQGRGHRQGRGQGQGDGSGWGGGHRRGGGGPRTVYVLEDGKPVARQVKLGISDGTSQEVLEGLKEGDLVITASTAPNPSGAARSAPGGGSPLGGLPRRF